MPIVKLTRLEHASALVPLAMSLVALALVVVHVATVGITREADEGTAARLWQLLMAGQIPFIAFCAIIWLPRRPRQGLRVLALQAVAGIAAAAPVFLLEM
jgi:cytochrome bd-type quinol oxidase subunit 2